MKLPETMTTDTTHSLNGFCSILQIFSENLFQVCMMMIPSILTVVCFNENELKMVGFWIHRFFSQRKILMSRIFYLSLILVKKRTVN